MFFQSNQNIILVYKHFLQTRTAYPKVQTNIIKTHFFTILVFWGQTWNTAFLLHKQILLYTALFEHFQCNMREDYNQIWKINTSIACTLAHYSMSGPLGLWCCKNVMHIRFIERIYIFINIQHCPCLWVQLQYSHCARWSGRINTE